MITGQGELEQTTETPLMQPSYDKDQINTDLANTFNMSAPIHIQHEESNPEATGASKAFKIKSQNEKPRLKQK